MDKTLFADLIAKIILLRNFSGFENYVVYFSMSLFSFMRLIILTEFIFLLFIFILVTIAISALISLFFDYFTIFRNPDLTKSKNLYFGDFCVNDYYFLISPIYFIIDIYNKIIFINTI